ncbi:MAG: MHS family MFS transporter [Burkholderiales bacterium]|nr:MHS family MFS transporter [Burkholderiales bacterium]
MQTEQRRALVASAVGSALEWYDFFIYGTAAALVFGDLFFPSLDPVMCTLAAFATFGVGFAARPIGGIVFGQIGDRIGRKPVLVLTLLLVGGGTFLIGLLPTYDSIGLWAPALLVLLRLVQGFGAGAEYGGAVLLAVEYAPPGKRGLYGSWAPIGVTVGNLVAAGVFAVVSLMPQEQFLAWGWRIPFLLSIVLVVVGFYIRAKVTETPVFLEAMAKRGKVARSPVLEVMRRHPREIFVVIGARMAENGLGYLFPVFALSYLTKTLGVPRSDALRGLMIAYVLQLITIPLFSALSDRIGRRPVYAGAAIFSGLYAYPFFLLIGTRDPLWITLGLIGGISIGLAGMFGPQAAYFAELFSTRMRFSGFALAREIGSILAGGVAPFVSAWLIAEMHGAPWGVVAYMIAMCIVTTVAVLVGPETYRADLHAERGAPAADRGS